MKTITLSFTLTTLPYQTSAPMRSISFFTTKLPPPCDSRCLPCEGGRCDGRRANMGLGGEGGSLSRDWRFSLERRVDDCIGASSETRYDSDEDRRHRPRNSCCCPQHGGAATAGQRNCGTAAGAYGAVTTCSPTFTSKSISIGYFCLTTMDEKSVRALWDSVAVCVSLGGKTGLPSLSTTTSMTKFRLFPALTPAYPLSTVQHLDYVSAPHRLPNSACEHAHTHRGASARHLCATSRLRSLTQ